jgi:hypothetical protein
MAEERGLSGTQEKEERPPLEDVTRRLMKAVTEDTSMCVTVFYTKCRDELYERVQYIQ